VDGQVSEKLFEMMHFWVLLYPEELELAPPGPPESFGMEKMRETAPKEAVGHIIDIGPGRQNGNSCFNHTQFTGASTASDLGPEQLEDRRSVGLSSQGLRPRLKNRKRRKWYE
jgi:hypothetical protein